MHVVKGPTGFLFTFRGEHKVRHLMAARGMNVITHACINVYVRKLVCMTISMHAHFNT